MLRWYVLRHDFSSGKVTHYNCLSYWEDKIKKARKKFTKREDLKVWLRKEFMYYYWSKAECEIQVGGLFIKSENELQKIDIWYQLEPNLDIITDYIITELKFRNLK